MTDFANHQNLKQPSYLIRHSVEDNLDIVIKKITQDVLRFKSRGHHRYNRHRFFEMLGYKARKR